MGTRVISQLPPLSPRLLMYVPESRTTGVSGRPDPDPDRERLTESTRFSSLTRRDLCVNGVISGPTLWSDSTRVREWVSTTEKLTGVQGQR